jgi:hypothetical protein
LVLLITSACTQPSSAGTGATAFVDTSFTVAAVPENLVAVTINVDPSNPDASDKNPGTPALPFQTLAAAIRYADNATANGSGAMVLVHDGVYREALQMPARDSGIIAPLVIEAVNPGHAIVSGSDVWTGWQRQGSGNLWTHAWPYQWGLAPYPPGWQGNVVLQPIVRRREMVFVNGSPLVQVLLSAQLGAGTFYVSEDAATITVEPAAGVDLAASQVEVAVRSPVLQIQGRNNVVLRGLTFQHANTPLPNAAVEVTDSAGVLVDNCLFTLNNWDGLDVLVSSDVTLQQSKALNNGGSGMGAYQLLRVLANANETSSNNWRGAAGGFTGWAVAGGKFGSIHNGIIRDYTSLNNQARGFWLDFDNVNVTLDGARLGGNNGDGVFLEASEGPLQVMNTCSSDNSGAGIAGSNTSDVVIAGNLIRGNAGGQVLITGATDREVTNFETGGTFDVQIERWTIRGDLLVSQNQSQAWVVSPSWSWFVNSLASDWNMWSYSADDQLFVLGGESMSMTAWRNETGQDYDSIEVTGAAANAAKQRIRGTPCAQVQTQ